MIATPNVPILFAVSPLRAMRSAPTTIASTPLRCIVTAAALSVISVHGTPASRSSNIVRRAPCSSGRVSSTNTCSALPARCAAMIVGERRALAAGRDRTRVAVRHHVALARQHLGAEASDARIDVALFGVDRLRFGEIIAIGAREHAIDRIREIDRRRTRFANARGRGGRTPSPVCSCAASAMPYAPKMPIAGAPRTASVAIASTTLVDRRRPLAHDGLRQRPLVEIPDGVTVIPYRIHIHGFRGRTRRIVRSGPT